MAARDRSRQEIQLAQGRARDRRGLQGRRDLDWDNRTAMSKIAIIGAGYVGLTTAACLADLGNEVGVVDIDEAKIRQLRRHRLPFFEPGLQEVVEHNARAGRLRFTTSYNDAVPGAEFAFIAV